MGLHLPNSRPLFLSQGMAVSGRQFQSLRPFVEVLRPEAFDWEPGDLGTRPSSAAGLLSGPGQSLALFEP